MTNFIFTYLRHSFIRMNSGCCAFPANAIFKKGKSIVKFYLMVLFVFISATAAYSQCSTHDSPACNLEGILKACLRNGHIFVTTTVAISSDPPTLTYTLPVNTTGASLVGTSFVSYNDSEYVETVEIDPGDSSGSINLELNVGVHYADSCVMTCECSKSITIRNVTATSSFTPIHCNGGISTLTVVGNGATFYTYTLSPGGLSNDTGVFSGLLAGTYTVDVAGTKEGITCDTSITTIITQPDPNPVVLNCPAIDTVAACQSQETINAEFRKWVGQFTSSGGTNPVIINNLPQLPPGACEGGSVTVVDTVYSDCQQPVFCSSTFVVNPASPVVFNCTEDLIEQANQSQGAIDTAFLAWLGGTTASGGCNGVFTTDPANPIPPSNCGGTTTVTWTYTSSCADTRSCTKTFTVIPPSATVNPADSVVICEGTCAVLCASPGATYLWSPGEKTTQCIKAWNPGRYIVEVTNEFGCSDTAGVNLIVNPPPTVMVIPQGPTVICKSKDASTVQLCADGAVSYVWSTGETTICIATTASGTYSVVGTDKNGCTASDNQQVTINSPSFGDTAAVACQSFTWYNTLYTQSTTDTHVFPGGNSVGCDSTVTLHLTINPLPEVGINPDGLTTFCDGGSVQLCGTGASSYVWSPGGQTDNCITVSTGGGYLVVGTDRNGCSSSASISVTVNEPTFGDTTAVACQSFTWYGTLYIKSTTDTHVFSKGNSLGCDSTVTLHLTINPLPEVGINPDGLTTFCDGGSVQLCGAGASSYIWSPGGQTDNCITVSSGGAYTVVGTDRNGCSSSASISVTVNEPSFGDTTAVACQSFSWYGTLYIKSTTDIHVFSKGNSLGCDSTVTLHLTINPLPDASCSGDFVLTCFNPTTLISVNNCDGAPDRSYSWNGPGGFTSSLQCNVVNVAGTYTVTVTNTLTGCTNTCVTNITSNQAPPPCKISDISPSNLICNHGNYSVSTSLDTSLYTFSWSISVDGNPPGWAIVGSDTGQSVTFSAGNCGNSGFLVHVTLTVTDKINGCVTTCSRTFAPGAPECIVSIRPTVTLTCLVSSEYLLTSYATDIINPTFDWTLNGGSIGAGINNGSGLDSILISSPGTYRFTITDPANSNNTCFGEAIVIQDTISPIVSITPNGKTTFCNGGNVQLCAGGAASYIWSPGGQTDSCITVSAGGDYSVTGTTANGCTGTASISVTINQPSQGDTTASACVSFTWYGTLYTESTTDTHVFSKGNSLGCDSTLTLHLTINPLPKVGINPDGLTTFCDGGSVELCGTGASSYIWSPGGQTDPCITASTGGAYSVVGTDRNGCSSSASISVTVNEPSFGDTIAVACQSFTWYGTLYTQSTTDTHVFSKGNSVGCDSTVTLHLTVNPLHVVSITPDGSTSFCEGGSVGLCASQGSAYLWSPGGQTDRCITVLNPGHNVVQVTNEFGCSDTAGVDIHVSLPPTVMVATTNGSCLTGGVGSACANVSGGSGNYHYLWNTGDTTSCIQNLAQGSYTLTVTDDNHCSASDAGYISVTSNPVVACSTDTVAKTIAANPSGGTGPYTYSWNTVPVQTTQSISYTHAGTYTVIITDKSGCTASCSSTIVSDCSGFRTETQGGWGTVAHGNNPGVYRDANFASAFPTGLAVGCNAGFTLTLTTSLAVQNFLPSGTTPRALTANLVDPGGSYRNVFAGQVVTLALNVGFDLYDPSFGSSTTHLQDLIIASGPFQGWTVAQLLAQAELELGGCSSTYKISDLNDAVDAVNNNYDDGTVSGNFLICPCTPPACSLQVPNKLPVCGSAGNNLSSSITGTNILYSWSVSGAGWVITSGANSNTITYTAGSGDTGTFTLVVTDGLTKCSGTCTVSYTCTNDCNGFRTETQGGWGTVAHGNNPGVYRDANFAGAFPTGLTVGCNAGFTLTLTTSLAVQNFLPSGTTPRALTTSLVDPGGSYRNVFAGQVVTLALNVGFDLYDPNFGSSSLHLQDLSIASGPFKGWTVAQLLAQAELELGGCSSAYNISDLNDAVDAVNNNYDDGTVNGNYLTCACVPPSCNISGKGSICDGGSATLCATGGQGLTYLWSNGKTTQCITVRRPGTFSVTVTNVSGCSSTSSKTVTVSDAPICDISSSCNGNMACESHATLCGPDGYASYQWSTGATTKCITVWVKGIYSLTVTNSAGCSSTCSKSVKVGTPPPCDIYGNTRICKGECTTLCGPDGYGLTYYWSTGEQCRCIKVKCAGTYYLTVTNSDGCSSTCSVCVTVYEAPACCIEGNLTIRRGECTTLCAPYGCDSYQWSNGSHCRCITVCCPGVYSVTVTNSNGCSSTCYVNVTYQSGCWQRNADSQGDGGNINASAYPNPFNSFATIEFMKTDAASHARVEVYTLDGKMLAVLFDEDVDAGVIYKATFDGTNLPNGIYMYKIISDNDVVNGKLILGR